MFFHCAQFFVLPARQARDKHVGNAADGQMAFHGTLIDPHFARICLCSVCGRVASPICCRCGRGVPPPRPQSRLVERWYHISSLSARLQIRPRTSGMRTSRTNRRLKTPRHAIQPRTDPEGSKSKATSHHHHVYVTISFHFASSVVAVLSSQ